MREEELAVLLLEASAHSLEDRFLGSLSPETRDYYRKTIQMRSDFLSDVQRMLTSGSQAEALLYADRVRSSAMEVAHRWGYYRHMLERYAGPVRVKVPDGPA